MFSGHFDTSGCTSAGVRNKNFEIPHCAHMVRQNCSQIAQTVKAFNPFLLIVSKKDHAPVDSEKFLTKAMTVIFYFFAFLPVQKWHDYCQLFTNCAMEFSAGV